MKYFLSVVVLAIILIVLLCISATIGDLNNIYSYTDPMSSNIDQNRSIYIVWHIILYISIFLGLYLYSNHLINKHKFKNNKKNELLYFCYGGTGVVVFIDLIYLLGRLI